MAQPYFAVGLLVLSGMAGAAGQAQPAAGAWNRVEHLARGADLRVITVDGASYRGELSQLDARDLTLRIDDGSQTIERDRICEVRLNRGTHSRRKHVLYGMLIAVGGALAAGQLTCRSTNCQENLPLYVDPALGGGALAGALMPAHDWEVIYRRPSVP